MRKKIGFLSIIIFTLISSSLYATDGKKVFETYCWGCHHQTAVAFGPPFEEIASKRTADEIRAMISDPKSVSKILGYRRNAMPPFKLSEENLTAISNYILSYKREDLNVTKLCSAYVIETNESSDVNVTSESNKTTRIVRQKKEK